MSYPGATLRGMGESAVSNAAIADAAELLTQKADMLLERLADRVIARRRALPDRVIDGRG
jgi:hypothetical protein